MIIVLFEVTVKKDFMDHYLTLAEQLKPQLKEYDGLIHAERFKSLSEDGKLLSMNIWKNEASIAAWRNDVKHRMAQSKGKNNMFESFKITVCESIRTYTNNERSEAPTDSKEYFAHGE